jgi:hypothetical protein
MPPRPVGSWAANDSFAFLRSSLWRRALWLWFRSYPQLPPRPQLSITTPEDAGNLGTVANTVSGTTISAPLGEVQVNDARSAAAGAGWVATAISTALTPPAGPTIAANLIGYTAGSITKIGTATYTANDPADLTGAAAVVTATGITGDNSATWNPTINVAIPGAMAAGVYSGTITHSVT